MTDARRRPRKSVALQRFLDGYLHQDFRLEHRDAADAAAAFAAEANGRERRWTAEALWRFAAWAEEVDEDTWRTAWKAQGGAWRPPGIDAIRALAGVIEASR